MKLELELDVKSPRLDPLCVLGIVVVADRVSKELEPADDVLGGDVRVHQHSDQHLVADFRFRDVVVAKDSSEEKIGVPECRVKEIEIGCWMNLSEFYRVFELESDPKASARILPKVVDLYFVELAFENLRPNESDLAVGKHSVEDLPARVGNFNLHSLR